MGCTNNKSIDTLPPAPKDGIEVLESIPPTYRDLRSSISSTTRSVTDHSSDNSVSNADKATWMERRNSQREKDNYVKRKTREARIELEKRITYRNIVSIKCPKCGDIGPEQCNKYYGFYLLVNELRLDTKCRRCNVNFSYEHVGVVKTINNAINEIIQELTE